MSGIRILFVGLALVWAGCSTDGRGGTPRRDSGMMEVDTGPGVDAGEVDAGEEVDAGDDVDSGGMDVDAGMMTPDSGPPDSGPPDSGPPDSGPVCGDGVVAASEACDDAGTTAGDGCSATCALEPGFTCMGAPSTCATTCGDGVMAGAEACDDGNAMAGDGCAACMVEPGFSCMGTMPSVCAAVCGDGMLAATEACDDGDMSDLDCCSSACADLCTESEDNGTVAAADAITAGTPVTGGIEPASDVDYWVFTLSAPSNLVIETRDGMGGPCPTTFDTFIDLLASDGMTVIDSDDDTGTGNCSLITAMTDATVRALPAGTYYIRVRAFDPADILDRYTLSLTATASGCGDGFTVAPETCDDGNTTSGDGCDSMCRVEARCGNGFLDAGEACDDGNMVETDCCTSACATLCTEVENNGTSATANPLTPGTPVTGSITPAGDIDFWSFTLTAESHVRIETFDGTGTACGGGIDTLIELRASDGTTVILSDDDDGINNCSLINHAVAADMAARFLAPGTYYVRVRAFSAAATIPRYTLAVTTTAAGCGDTYIRAPETCDDGNAVSGDGCSATCMFESPCGNGMIDAGEACDDGDTSSLDCCSATCADLCTEMEDNGTFMVANPVTSGMPVTGGIEPANDTDFWSFTLTAPSNVRVETFDASGSDCVAINTTVALLRPDGTSVIITDFDDGINLCSLINPAVDAAARGLAAGTYYVRVRASSTTAVIDRYTLVVTTTPSGCGDTFVNTGEECDDGNMVSGDGCSATCTFESMIVTETEPNEDGTPSTGGTGTLGNDFGIATAGGPYSTDIRVMASFAVAGDEDVFAFTNSGVAPVMVRFSTATDAIGTMCTAPTDTVLRIRDAAGMSLALSDDDGVNNCSLLTYTIPAGTTVYAHLSEFGDNEVVAGYYLIAEYL